MATATIELATKLDVSTYAETRVRTARQSEDEILAALRRRGFTGAVTLNFSQGAVCDVLMRHRIPSRPTQV